MSIDPETLEYLPVEAWVMEMAAAAYRDGLTTRLTARAIVTDDLLPTLSFLGHSLGPQPVDEDRDQSGISLVLRKSRDEDG